MKYFGWMLFWVVLGAPRLGWATAQEPDLLVYRSDTLLLQANPLEQWLSQQPARPAEFSGSGSTACWRGYQATWQLENDQLYLVRLAPGCQARAADLRRWFAPDAGGRVAATWVTGRLVVAMGKLLHYEHAGYASIYEQDWVLTIQQGRLVQQQTFTNQACQSFGPPGGSQAFSVRLHRAIDWRRVPALRHARPLVVLKFQPDSLGHGGRALLVKPAGPLYDSLALAAARTLAPADWGACYRFGRWLPQAWYVPIRFDEANRRRYRAGARRRQATSD